MKMRTYLIKLMADNESGYTYDKVMAGNANTALSKWLKTAGEKVRYFIRIEDMNGVVQELKWKQI